MDLSSINGFLRLFQRGKRASHFQTLASCVGVSEVDRKYYTKGGHPIYIYINMEMIVHARSLEPTVVGSPNPGIYAGSPAAF